MRLLFRGAKGLDGRRMDISVSDGGVVSSAPVIFGSDFDRVFELDGTVVFPGFAAAHVHLREPGFSYKETVLSGSRAAARMGYSCLLAMPNVNPAPDTLPNLNVQRDLIRTSAHVRVIPYGSLTMGRRGQIRSDMAAMAPYVAGFSDDGSGIESDELMRSIMQKAKELGRVVAQHCEVPGIPGDDPESEWRMAKRDIELVRETGCRYHICHVSSRVTLELVRRAKQDGLPVTCETAPHYLLLNKGDVQDDGRFKMNPPIREKEDQEALIQGVLDGTVDIIATDHAPHSAQEKSRGFAGSLMGIVGLETAFPVLWRSGLFPLERLVEAMSLAPRRIFGLKGEGDFAFFDLDETYTIDPAEFLSMGKSTPFEGWTGRGRCVTNVVNGKVVWPEDAI